MKCYFTCILFLVNISLSAQHVQWSSKILDFSTQFETNDFSAIKLLGPPDVPADGGRHPLAWMASSSDAKEFIVVGFDSAIYVRQIAIFESFNPGAVYKVYLYDDQNILHAIGTLNPKPVKSPERVLHIVIDETPYKVNAVRLIIDGSSVPGFNAIDAIGISNSAELIHKRKNFAYRTNPRLKTEEINLNANDNESDTRPVYSDRMKRLYFTRGYSSRNAGSKSDPGDVMVVLYSEANNSFSSPISMGDEINNIGFNTTNGIINDEGSEKLLIGNVTGNVTKIDPNVSLVGKDGKGNWTAADKQDIRKSGIYDLDVDYHMTADRKAMFLAMEGKNSLGGRDIYVCFNIGSNKWSEPENLGAGINTPEDEFAPFFSGTENALYFASAGHGGMGGSDIFRAVRLDDTFKSWSDPENVGADINTEMNEKYFYFDEQDKTAFFARAKDETSYGIFKVERPEFIDPNPQVTLSGKVSGDGNPLSAAISLFSIPDDELYSVTFSDESTGLYTIHLRSGNDYKLLGESEGFRPEEILVSLENRQEPYAYDLDLKLSRELMEDAPELQEEIAEMAGPVHTEESRATGPNAVNTSIVTGTVQSSGQPAVDQSLIDSKAKANKLASLPQAKTEDDEQDVGSSQKQVSSPAGTETANQTTASTKQNEPEANTTASVSEPAKPALTTASGSITNGSERKNTKTKVEATNLIRFDFNSDELMPESSSILNVIADFLNRHETIKLEIGGFTDYIGDEMYNVELGRRRARTVKNYLTGTGIEGNRIKIIGFGEKMPISLSADQDQLMINRRVEFNFTK